MLIESLLSLYRDWDTSCCPSFWDLWPWNGYKSAWLFVGNASHYWMSLFAAWTVKLPFWEWWEDKAQVFKLIRVSCALCLPYNTSVTSVIYLSMSVNLLCFVIWIFFLQAPAVPWMSNVSKCSFWKVELAVQCLFPHGKKNVARGAYVHIQANFRFVADRDEDLQIALWAHESLHIQQHGCLEVEAWCYRVLWCFALGRVSVKASQGCVRRPQGSCQLPCCSSRESNSTHWQQSQAFKKPGIAICSS